MLIDAVTYDIIKKSIPIPCVDLIILNDKSEILMVKRNNDPAIGEWWFPGGRVHFNETRIETVERKLKEECGLEAVDIQEMGTEDLILSNSNNTISHAITTVFKVIAVGEVRLDNQSECYEQKAAKDWLLDDIHSFIKKSIIKYV